MPFKLPDGLRRVSQSEFARMAYDVMEVVFSVRNDLGRLFDERVYETEIARRMGKCRTQVPIEVSFESFSKTLFVDLIYNDCTVFELKATEATVERHRAQLMNYLLILEVPQGKLVNLRPESVQHEFVNAPLRRADRIKFQVENSGFKADGDGRWIEWLVALFRDWGTCLEVALYEEALTHFLGGESMVVQPVDVRSDGTVIGKQPLRLLSPDTAFRITGFENVRPSYQRQLERLLDHTALKGIQWINVGRKTVTFKTIEK